MPVVFLLDVRIKNSYINKEIFGLLLLIKDHRTNNKNLTNT